MQNASSEVFRLAFRSGGWRSGEVPLGLCGFHQRNHIDLKDFGFRDLGF